MSQKVTEAEAKKKWCRHAFVPHTHVHERATHAAAYACSINRQHDLGNKHCCLASGCMDWAWFDEPEEEENRLGYCDVARKYS